MREKVNRGKRTVKNAIHCRQAAAHWTGGLLRKITVSLETQENKSCQDDDACRQLKKKNSQTI